MTFQQLVPPRLETTDGAGWCHRFARNVFGAPMGYSSAWEAWEATEYKHSPSEPLPSDAAVLLWFSHYGTYGSPPRYGNWGHVTVNVPGVGILTSPGYGVGQEIWSTIGQIEARFGCKYVGWTEDINGLRVAQPDGTGGLKLSAKAENEISNTYAGLWYGGRATIDGVVREFRYGVLPIVAHNQELIAQGFAEMRGQNAALLEAIKQLAGGGGQIDMTRIAAAATEGAERGAKEILSSLILKAEVKG